MDLLHAKAESSHAVEDLIRGLDPGEGRAAFVVSVDVRQDVLGSAAVVMARSFTYWDTSLTWTFLPLLVLDFIAFLACMICLSRAYFRQIYTFLPLLQDIEKSREEFLGFATPWQEVTKRCSMHSTKSFVDV